MLDKIYYRYADPDYSITEKPLSVWIARLELTPQTPKVRMMPLMP